VILRVRIPRFKHDSWRRLISTKSIKMCLLSKTQDTRKKLSEMENKRKNSGEEAERLRNALQEAQVSALLYIVSS
jgi:hypothetical protein